MEMDIKCAFCVLMVVLGSNDKMCMFYKAKQCLLYVPLQKTFVNI